MFDLYFIIIYFWNFDLEVLKYSFESPWVRLSKIKLDICVKNHKQRISYLERTFWKNTLSDKQTLTLHPPPLLLQPVTVPVGSEGDRKLLVNDLPRPVLQRRQRTVQPLVLDDVHVLPAQLQQEVLLLVGPVLRPLALLEPLGRPQRTLQHPEMLDLLTFRRVRQFFLVIFYCLCLVWIFGLRSLPLPATSWCLWFERLFVLDLFSCLFGRRFGPHGCWWWWSCVKSW